MGGGNGDKDRDGRWRWMGLGWEMEMGMSIWTGMGRGVGDQDEDGNGIKDRDGDTERDGRWEWRWEWTYGQRWGEAWEIGMKMEMGIRTEMGRGMQTGMGMEMRMRVGKMGSRTETGTASRGFSAEFAAFRHAASLAAPWVQAWKMGMFSQWPGRGGGSHQELGVSQLHRGQGLSPERVWGGLPAPPVGKRLGVPTRALLVALPGQGGGTAKLKPGRILAWS